MNARARVLRRNAHFSGQDHELRPAMVRVRLERNESLFVQIIDDPLNVLTMRTQVASEPCDRLRPIRKGSSAPPAEPPVHSPPSLPERTCQYHPRSRTSLNHQPEARHPKSSAIHKLAGRLPYLTVSLFPFSMMVGLLVARARNPGE